jgi:hypothetical protein
MLNVNLKERFYPDLLRHGAYALLPAHLNDEWLDFLTRQALLVSNELDSSKFSELLSAVLSILYMRANYKTLCLSQSELLNYLHLYSIELHVETLNRTGDTKIESATIDTILTDLSLDKTDDLAKAWK